VSTAIQHKISLLDPGCKPKIVTCNGSAECAKLLKSVKDKKADFNFVEGMTCQKGCIGGPSSFNHSGKAKSFIDTYSKNVTSNQKECMEEIGKDINLTLL